MRETEFERAAAVAITPCHIEALRAFEPITSGEHDIAEHLMRANILEHGLKRASNRSHQKIVPSGSGRKRIDENHASMAKMAAHRLQRFDGDKMARYAFAEEGVDHPASHCSLVLCMNVRPSAIRTGANRADSRTTALRVVRSPD